MIDAVDKECPPGDSEPKFSSSEYSNPDSLKLRLDALLDNVTELSFEIDSSTFSGSASHVVSGSPSPSSSSSQVSSR